MPQGIRFFMVIGLSRPWSCGMAVVVALIFLPRMVINFLKDCLELLEPLSLLWLGLLAFTLWLRRQKLGRAAKLSLGLWLFLTATSCLSLGDRLLASLENPWRSINTQWASLPSADAIVCLGGGVEASRQELIGLNVQDTSDRPTTAIDLLRQGRAPRLLIGGGASRAGELGEAESVKAWVERWQLSSAEVLSLGVCADTHDEALKVAALAKAQGWKRILLVTSASHMKRAAAVFRQTTGLEVVPVPCAFMTRLKPTHWVHLPSPEEYERFSNWFHETVGWVAYRLRGWI